MSKSCCAPAEAAIGRRRRVLWIVLGINGAMFVAELIAGLVAGSVALQADSLDMLGDTLVYGFSLAVVAGSARTRARAAQLKGVIMLGFGLAVLGQVLHKVRYGLPPSPLVVSAMGSAALFANLICVGLLFRHRDADVNMRSTWICSRNDIVANVGVLVSALGVARFASIWPDVLVSLGIVGLFLISAGNVLRQAHQVLRARSAPPSGGRCRTGACRADACHCAAT